jgi:hypothetical protein
LRPFLWAVFRIWNRIYQGYQRQSVPTLDPDLGPVLIKKF